MQLSTISKQLNFNISSNCKIENLKFLFQKKKKSLVFAKDYSYIEKIISDQDVVVAIIPTGSDIPKNNDIIWITSDEPEILFFDIHEFLCFETDFYYSHGESMISPAAKISTTAEIANHDVVIEEGVVIGDFVKIFPNTSIGKNTVVQSGCVLGEDGIHAIRRNGIYKISTHGGRVSIAENVTIGANTVIDKGLFHDTTSIGINTIVGSLVKLAHNVEVGKNTIITANCHLAGASKIGDNVFLGPNVTVGGQCLIGDGANVSLGTVVGKDIPENKRVIGRSVGFIPV